MRTKNIYNYLEKDQRRILVTIRLEKNILLEIDQLTENRSEFIRNAILFYIKFIRFKEDVLKMLKKLDMKV